MSSGEATFSLDEYGALRDGHGFVELAGWSCVVLTGTDRQTFLHNFCTNDVKRLKPGENCEAFVTNVKGKVVGHGLVVCRENELVLVTVPGQSLTLIEHLERYIIREDVNLRDATAERGYVLVAGVPSGQIVEFLDEFAAPVMNWSMSGSFSGVLVEVPAEQMAELRDALIGAGVTECGGAAFEAVRIEAGWPFYGVDIDDANLPQEVGRNAQAISFTKGCYLGQETVARIDALGHVNQQLTGVRFAAGTIPARGMILTRAGATVGQVTSASHSPQLGAPLALAMVRREFLGPGTELVSVIGACEVVTLALDE